MFIRLGTVFTRAHLRWTGPYREREREAGVGDWERLRRRPSSGLGLRDSCHRCAMPSAVAVADCTYATGATLRARSARAHAAALRHCKEASRPPHKRRTSSLSPPSFGGPAKN